MTIKIKSCLGRKFHKKVVRNKPSWDDDNIYSYLKLTKPLWQPQWKKPEPVIGFRRNDVSLFERTTSPKYSALIGNTFFRMAGEDD